MTLIWPLANIQRLPGRLYYIDCKFSIIIYRFVLLVSVNNPLTKGGLVRFACVLNLVSSDWDGQGCVYTY